jgi:hypothetical protein
MSDPSFRQLAAFRMSFWNKQIGSESGVFGDQKSLFGQLLQLPNERSSLMFSHFR